MSEPVSPFAEDLPSPVERAAVAGVSLAEAVESDLAELAALQVGVRGGVRGGTLPEWSGRIARTMRSALSAVVVARVGTEIAGYGNVMYLARHPEDDAPEGYYLMGVSVAHRWRRRGIGDAMTRWRMAWGLGACAGSLVFRLRRQSRVGGSASGARVRGGATCAGLAGRRAVRLR